MDKGADNRIHEKWKLELSKFVDGLDVGYKRQKGVRDNFSILGLDNWKREVAVN